MTSPTRTTSLIVLKLAGLTALALLAIGAIIGWYHFGADILLDAAASGLSWCF
jgi:hypothetical protein